MEGGATEHGSSFGDGLAVEARSIIAEARNALADPKLSEPEAVHETMMCLFKTHEDKSRMTREVTARLLGKVA